MKQKGRNMHKGIFLLFPFLLISCSMSSLNPFHKEESPNYKPYIPVEETSGERTGLRGIDNVVYYMKKVFKPVEGEIVLNSYDGFVVDIGKEAGLSLGDKLVSESGAVLKVNQVKDKYSLALPTIGNPMVGERVRKLTFNRVLFLDFTKGRGRELYEKIKKEIPYINLAEYSEGERFKRSFNLRFPADFRRRVPSNKLTGYDGYFVVSENGVEVFDNLKKLVKIFPWEGPPASSFSVIIGSGYKVVADLNTHATSLFVGNVDSTPQNEIAVATENDIRIYRVKPNGLIRVGKFRNPFPGSYLFHVSPLSLNGSPSVLIVDAFYQDTKSVSSGIFRLESGKLRKVAVSNLILSGFDTDGDGVNDAVFAQEVDDAPDKLFGKKVWKMVLSDGKLRKSEEIETPKEFQVTSAQIFTVDGKQYFAYYDLDYFFNVSDGKEVLWRSPIQIGASPNCLYWYNEDMLVSYYITPKPKAVDMDGDGSQEVLFSQNKNAVPGILRNIYTFDGGRILLLKRTGTSFDWEEATASIYNFGGLEEFGYLPEHDLFVSVFTEGGILKNPKSKILFIKPKI